MNAQIVHRQRIPSPHPRIHLYLITYVSQGLRVKAYLAEPITHTKLPGLVYLRGGIKNVGMPRIARVIQFASEGFIVIAPFYRGNKGGQGREDFAGADRYDAFYAYQLLKEHRQVLNGRIHLFGFSRGGVMALLTGLAYSDVCSITCWNGVTDMTLTYNERVDLRKMLKRVIGGTPNTKTEQYRWRTPLTELEAMRAPVCVIHGKCDQHVSFAHAEKLIKHLQQAGKQVEPWIFAEFNHFFPEPDNRNLVKTLAAWMKRQPLQVQKKA